MTFLDLFAGIGGFRLGMEMAGHECLGHCEIDKFAERSYRAMHRPKEGEWSADNIARVGSGDVPEADCSCFGFPCQSFSIAGDRRGFEDTRGTLFFEVMRLARARKPRILFAENVPGLLHHDGGRTFGTILRTMDGMGYDVEWQVLNSKDFGVPQNRERVFIVGHLRGTGGRKIFPVGGESEADCGRIVTAGRIGTHQTDAVQDPAGISRTLKATDHKNPQKIALPISSPETAQSGGRGAKTRLRFIDMDPSGKTTDVSRCLQARYDKGITRNKGECSGVAIPVLTPDRVEKRQNGRRFKTDGEPMFTLTARDRHGVALREERIGGIYTGASPGFQRGPIDGLSRALKADKADAGVTDGIRIRRLTPKECFRLQGFPDEYFERAAAVNSDSQLYKQAGNSVTVNVIRELAKRLE